MVLGDLNEARRSATANLLFLLIALVAMDCADHRVNLQCFLTYLKQNVEPLQLGER